MTDIQDFVKQVTAPYKYPREIEFRATLPERPSRKDPAGGAAGGRLAGDVVGCPGDREAGILRPELDARRPPEWHRPGGVAVPDGRARSAGTRNRSAKRAMTSVPVNRPSRLEPAVNWPNTSARTPWRRRAWASCTSIRSIA